jgi:ubiquinone/menaquinone biosynthesis C-methylase UbiE
MDRTADAVLAEQAAAYVRGRPDYPVAMEPWLRDALGLGPGKVVVDLASGTGKILPRLMATGATVIAIEPLAQMRAHLAAIHPRVDAREGRAQAIPLADASVDALTCAQCSHLFATPEALAEIRRVLKPGGAFGLTWNIRDAACPWVARIIDIMAPYEHGLPHYESRAWKALFPADGFSALQEQSFANPQTGSPENVIVDRVLSVHSIAKLPIAERDKVIASVRDVIAGHPDLAGKARITFPNITWAYHCRKTG